MNKNLVLVDNFNEEELFQIKGGMSATSRDIVICIGSNSGKGKEEPKPIEPKE